MDLVVEQIQHLQILNQFWLSLFLLIPIILVARTVVAGTKFSPILIIVVFGLAMGYVLTISGVATQGLPEFPIVDLISKTTIVALTVSFFVGGQEIRKIFSGRKIDVEDMVVPSKEEVVLGTSRTQVVYIVRSFFQLLAVFGGFTVLALAGMPIGYSAMAKSSAISHFGLFAATQGGMFGSDEATMIPFIFAMPFLIHPFVFYMFGKAMERDGEMPKIPVFVLAGLGLIGIIFALISV